MLKAKSNKDISKALLVKGLLLGASSKLNKSTNIFDLLIKKFTNNKNKLILDVVSKASMSIYTLKNKGTLDIK